MSTTATPVTETPAAASAPASSVAPVTVTITPEITALIEAARTDEKKKLYADIERLNTELASTKTSAERATALETELTEVKSQLTAVSAARTPAGEIDVKKLIEEIGTSARQTMQAQMSDLEAQVKALDAENKKAQLASIKQAIIAEANGEIITGLLVGNTEAEIRASAIKAKQAFSDIKLQITGTRAPTQEVTLPPAVSVTGVTVTGNPGDSTPQLVQKKGDMRDWKTRRNASLAALKAKFG